MSGTFAPAFSDAFDTEDTTTPGTPVDQKPIYSGPPRTLSRYTDSFWPGPRRT